tara:strand:+ start:440 stop:838 length:399 start_codon:yes stop_codon:yes gene_type:complete
MPSIRKRIGYLPSINIQKIITKIANKEKLSQSRLVGILVEEALIARGVFDHQKTNDLIRNSIYRKENNMNNSNLVNNEMDELISDKGIFYNSKSYSHNSDNLSSEYKEAFDKALFEKFKQFLLFQKMIEEKS